MERENVYVSKLLPELHLVVVQLPVFPHHRSFKQRLRFLSDWLTGVELVLDQCEDGRKTVALEPPITL